MTEYFLQREKRKVSLGQREFKADGGEGVVYVAGSTAYKVYHDPAQMIPAAKIQELSVLNLPEIVRPDDILLNDRNTAVGYSMRSVPDSFALCQVFPKSFRDRSGITANTMAKLVQKLQELVKHCHSKGILIVDLNEMNFLLGKDFKVLYAVDVDSFQTRSFPATALMDSVRDRHAAGVFTELTDWFSFAVVSFQMFVGIHPFKGKHPVWKTLDERMVNHCSVFNADVGIPAAVLPLDVIPEAYRQWYRAVFDGGKRTAPPGKLTDVIVLAPVTVKASNPGGAFTVTLMLDTAALTIPSPVTPSVSSPASHPRTITHHERNVTVTSDAVFVGQGCAAVITGPVVVAFTPRYGRPIVAQIELGHLVFWDLAARQALPARIAADQVMATEGRIYAKNGGTVSEILFIEAPNSVSGVNATQITLRAAASVSDLATTLYDGIAIQQALGTWYASFFPESGSHYSLRLTDLQGYRVVDAKYEGQVLIVAANRDGRYDRLVFRFEKDFSAWDVRITQDTGAHTPNFVVLDNGVVIAINERDEVEIFSSRRGSTGMKVIADPAIGGDCRLFKNGTQALFARGGQLYQFSVKVT